MLSLPVGAVFDKQFETEVFDQNTLLFRELGWNVGQPPRASYDCPKPILDMSDDHLRKLFDDVRRLK